MSLPESDYIGITARIRAAGILGLLGLKPIGQGLSHKAMVVKFVNGDTGDIDHLARNHHGGLLSGLAL
jgi:hypothetical protein